MNDFDREFTKPPTVRSLIHRLQKDAQLLRETHSCDVLHPGYVADLFDTVADMLTSLTLVRVPAHGQSVACPGEDQCDCGAPKNGSVE
jgi:hypothetical protein